MDGRRRAVSLRLACLAAGLLATSPSRAEGPAALGPPFAVGEVEYTSSAKPAVGADATGGFVVVWSDEYQDELVGRRYDANGNAAGPAFVVAPSAPGGGDDDGGDGPDVARNAAGAFVVVWEQDDYGAFDGINARRYDATGAPLGSQFLVGAAPEDGYVDSPSVGIGDDGAFVVVWEQTEYGSGGLDGIAARRYDAAGAPLGAAFLVASDTEDTYLEDADVAMNGAGAFVVAWEQEDYAEGALDGIAARRFDAAGAPLGAAFPVADDPESGSVDTPEVAISDAGAFVVAWEQEDYGVTALDGIAARRFDATGAPAGPAFLVGSRPESGGYLEGPGLAMDGAGAFTIVWAQEEYGSSPTSGILGRRFLASGEPDGGRFTVVADGGDDDSQVPAVAAHPAGFTVAWASRSYANAERDEKVFARRYATPEPQALAQGLAAWLALGAFAARRRHASS